MAGSYALEMLQLPTSYPKGLPRDTDRGGGPHQDDTPQHFLHRVVFSAWMHVLACF
jgi:hypothetical protein